MHDVLHLGEQLLADSVEFSDLGEGGLQVVTKQDDVLVSHGADPLPRGDLVVAEVEEEDAVEEGVDGDVGPGQGFEVPAQLHAPHQVGVVGKQPDVQVQRQLASQHLPRVSLGHVDEPVADGHGRADGGPEAGDPVVEVQLLKVLQPLGEGDGVTHLRVTVGQEVDEGVGAGFQRHGALALPETDQHSVLVRRRHEGQQHTLLFRQPPVHVRVGRQLVTGQRLEVHHRHSPLLH